MLLYGRKLSAAEAYSWSLASDVIPHSHFREEVSERIKRLAALPPQVCCMDSSCYACEDCVLFACQAVQLTKKLSRDSMASLLQDANKREVEVLKGRFTSEEAIEAAKRFFKK